MAGQNDAGGSGIDFTTLIIASLSSMIAAIVVHRLWGPGAIVSAAVTPVLVTLISEGLKKPTTVVTAATAVRREDRPPAPMPPPSPAHPAPGSQSADDPLSARRVYGASRNRKRWRIALATGGAAFVVAVFALTLGELSFGGSASGSGRSTTLFGGSKHKGGTGTTKTTTTRTTTSTTPGAEQPQTTTTTPAQTTPTPTQTVPAPTTTTPAPTATQPTPGGAAAPGATTTPEQPAPTP